MVKPEPVFDKFGNVSGGACEDGLIYVPGSVPELDECIPEDDCDPVFDSAGNIIDCYPESRRPDPGRNDGSSGTSGRSPTGSTSSTAAGGPRP